MSIGRAEMRIRMPLKLKELLDNRAASDRVSSAHLVRVAVQRYLDAPESVNDIIYTHASHKHESLDAQREADKERKRKGRELARQLREAAHAMRVR